MAFMVLFTQFSLMILPSQLLQSFKSSRGFGWLVCLVVFSLSGFAQDCADPSACNYNPDYVPAEYSFVTEVVSSDIGQLIGTQGTVDLTGYSTTRVYFQSSNPNDFVTSVSGDEITPIAINTTTDFYQAVLGAAVPNGIQPLLFSVYPELAYDSWVTIGIESTPDTQVGEANVSTIQSDAQPWVTAFDPGAGAPGGNILIDDPVGGAWFVLNGDANGFPDDDGRVLLGQFTTSGTLSGNLRVQLFPAGDNLNFILFDGPISDGGGGDGEAEGCLYLETYYLDEDGDGYGTVAEEFCGPPGEGYAEVGGDCNDNSAIAFPDNPIDLVGDGIDGDCDGAETCYRDTDNDGYRSADTTDFIGSPFNIDCSEFGEAYVYQPIDCDDVNPDLTMADEEGNCIDLSAADDGCSDALACNYDPLAAADELNCDFISCQGCGDPGACNYDPEAVILNSELCEFTTCAGCQDAAATNYEPASTISDGDLCVYSGLLAIAPLDIQFNDDNGSVGLYTNDVYAMLPPEAIQLNAVIGVKGSNIELRVSPWDQVYHSPSCGGWTPAEMGTISVEVDGVTYTNDDCFNDSWFTIGGSALDGPNLIATGFDPTTLDGAASFDSEDLAMDGDTLSWSLADGVGGVPSNHCAELEGRPGCQNAVRIARFTMPIGQPFAMQAGLTYTVLDGTERTVTGSEVTSDTDGEVLSDSGGGGEAEDPEEYGEDGEGGQIFGCRELGACNYDATATADGEPCDYVSCVGCIYPAATNYDEMLTVGDASCLFEGCTDSDYLEYSALANVSDEDQCVTLLVSGCTDADYLEFDELANVADAAACLTLIVEGCIYPDASNFNSVANRDDGSCNFEGCTDEAYLEYSAIADQDDGSCVTLLVVGCTDPDFLEFDEAANVTNLDACITSIVPGCTYSDATNFSSDANADNGTCTFAGGPSSSCPFDVAGAPDAGGPDGQVGAADLLAFLTAFGESCD